MNKQKIKEIGITAVIATLAVIVVLYVLGVVGVKPPLGGTDSVISKTASSTLIALTAATRQIAATSTCVARTITTGATSVALSFFDQPLDGSHLGKTQAASTTESYGAETFGCGGMRARATTGNAVQLEIMETF